MLTNIPNPIAPHMQNALTLFASSNLFSPKSREISELPPSPNMSPKAIIKVNTGTTRDTPATSSCTPVKAIKYVSTML